MKYFEFFSQAIYFFLPPSLFPLSLLFCPFLFFLFFSFLLSLFFSSFSSFSYIQRVGQFSPPSPIVTTILQIYPCLLSASPIVIYSAFNCTSSSTINAVLQAARDINSPVIIQFSNGGAAFMAGKGIKNTNEKASILGAIAGAQHVRLMAKHYNVPVVLHSDHCAKKLLPWFDGMLEANEEYFKVGTT